jgi:multiple sugar transport system permease protein
MTTHPFTTTATTTRRRLPRPSRARSHGGIAHTVLGVVILAVLLFPLYWMLNVSLQPSGGAVATPWLPTDISFHGYAKALHDQGGHLLTSLEIAIGSVIFSLLIAAPAAYALAQFRIRGASVVLLLVLISQMVPNIVVANALYGAYANLGLLNSVWGLIVADSSLGIPLAMLVLHAFMRSIPRSMMQAAEIDGAGPIRVFVSIVLPLSRNAHLDDDRGRATRDTRPLHVRRHLRRRLELGHGHGRDRLGPRPGVARDRPEVRRRGRDGRRRQVVIVTPPSRHHTCATAPVSELSGR